MPTNDDAATADDLVAEARRAIHESLIFLAAPEADRVRSLIADLETAVEVRTAIRMSAPVPSPPADRAALRKAVADAIRNATCTGNCGKPEEQCAQERIQPFAWHHGTLAVVEGSPEQFADAVVPVLPEPADRAAVLHEAADRFAAFDLHAEAAALRRMADETPDAEAHPAEHTWAAELYDPDADEWVPGTRYADRDRAVNALKRGRRISPTWRDGTPTQRRLVRVTTTYTVEPEAEPAARARQDGAQ